MVLRLHVLQTLLSVSMGNVFQSHGSVIERMTVMMPGMEALRHPMKQNVTMDVHLINLNAPTLIAFLSFGDAMDTKTASTDLMKQMTVLSESVVMDGSSVTEQVNASPIFGSVMERTTVEMQEPPMNILNRDAMFPRVIQRSSSVQTFNASSLLSIVMEMMIAETDLMNPSTAFMPSVPKTNSSA